MSETFGQRLMRWREAAGLTQGEVAGRVGVTVTYIAQLERGAGPAAGGHGMRPMIEVVDAIAEALDVPLAEVRCAAGYDPPAGSPASCEVVRTTFGESDFAALHRMYERLTPEQRRQLQPVLEMVSREIESMLRGPGDEHAEGKRADRNRRPHSSRRFTRGHGRPEVSPDQTPTQRERRRPTE